MWGKHLLVDMKGSEESMQFVSDRNIIISFLKCLVDAIDMKAYGEPVISLFGEGSDVSGYTVVQLIETSSIIAHFVNSTGDGYIDVFSCKEFDELLALEVIDNYFKPDFCYQKIIDRDCRKN